MFLLLFSFFQVLQASRPRAPSSRSPPTQRKLASAPTCNQEIMISYGLTGSNTPSSTAHKYCPTITSNCCTPDDVENTMTIWNSEHRPRIERYYEVYLYSVKYILGFSTEVTNLATIFEKSENIDCKNTAVEFKKMNMNPKIIQEIYKSFVISLEKMGSIRKGFFCTLCDATTQTQLSDYWSIVNLFYRDRIYYSRDFCRSLVDYTIRASYFTVYYLKTFAESSAKLINCKVNNTTRLTFDVDFWTTQQVKNCYYYKTKYFFFFCERYCEKFHLVKPSDILDGNLPQLKKFVDHIKLNREKAFDYPDNNILMDGVSYEEVYLDEHFDNAIKTEVFIKTSIDRVDLEKFKTDVVYTGGMNPWSSVDKSRYSIILAKVPLIQIAVTLFLFFV